MKLVCLLAIIFDVLLCIESSYINLIFMLCVNSISNQLVFELFACDFFLHIVYCDFFSTCNPIEICAHSTKYCITFDKANWSFSEPFHRWLIFQCAWNKCASYDWPTAKKNRTENWIAKEENATSNIGSNNRIVNSVSLKQISDKYDQMSFFSLLVHRFKPKIFGSFQIFKLIWLFFLQRIK